MIKNNWKLTLTYFVPIFLTFALFAGGVFYFMGKKVASIEPILRDIAYQGRSTIQSQVEGSGQESVYLIGHDYSTDTIEKVISSGDWETLSPKEIDEKLVKAGLKPIGDTKNPWYALKPNATSGVIRESDWMTLSMQEIDEKLIAHGLPRIGDSNDPLYTLTPEEIQKRYESGGVTYISSKQLEMIENSMNLEILLFLLGGVFMAFVIFMALAYFYTYRAQKPLREALAKQKQFVSDASHEIRTPLALMKTEAEVLLRDRHATEKDYEIFAQNVIQDIDTLNALTTRLLSLASLESKKESLRSPLDLFPLLESVITVFEARAQEKGITIENTGSPSTVALADEASLREVLVILIDNAIKYTRKPKSTIHLSVDEKKHDIEISITDEGEGIDPKHLPHIFDRFYRATEDRHESGYGLGLAIARELVERMGGKISLSSTVGKGTTATVSLPSRE